MEKFTTEFFTDLLSNATSINEAIQIMRNIQDEIEKSDGRKKAEEFGEKFNSFILKNWNTTVRPRHPSLTSIDDKADSKSLIYNNEGDSSFAVPDVRENSGGTVHNEKKGPEFIIHNEKADPGFAVDGNREDSGFRFTIDGNSEISAHDDRKDSSFSVSDDEENNNKKASKLSINIEETGLKDLKGRSISSPSSSSSLEDSEQILNSDNSLDGDKYHQGLASLLEPYLELLHHPYGEMDIAELFGILYKDKMHFVSEKKIYYIFNGKKWVPDIEHIQVKTYAKSFVKSILTYLLENEKENTDDIFYYNSYLGWRKRANLIEDCKTVSPLSVRDFDAPTYLFNCQNGTLRLDTNEFYEHRATDLLSLIANVEYKEGARCKRWEEFISEIMDGDLACIEFLQMICGLFLTSYTDEECFFLFYGIGGRNGKSTLCDTLVYLMGDYAKTAIPSTITKKSNNHLTAPNEDLARLRGCRLLSITGEDEKLSIDTRLIKNLTKHSKITARFPYQDSFEYNPQFKIIISTNYLPRVNDSRIFASNQLLLLPFPVHFELGEEEPGLREFFCQPENLSGIFNWCLEGLEKYTTLRNTSKQGLKFYLPKKIKERIEECKQEQDFSLVATFIQENLRKNEDKNISAKELFHTYSAWCRQKDYPRCNYRSFVRELRKQKTLTRRSEGFVIVGYTLKENS